MHNRCLELKEQRRKQIKSKYQYTGRTAAEITKCVKQDVADKQKIMDTFSDAYIEGFLIQNIKSGYSALVEVLVPKEFLYHTNKGLLSKLKEDEENSLISVQN